MDYSKSNSKVRFQDLSGLSPLVKINVIWIENFLASFSWTVYTHLAIRSALRAAAFGFLLRLKCLLG